MKTFIIGCLLLCSCASNTAPFRVTCRNMGGCYHSAKSTCVSRQGNSDWLQVSDKGEAFPAADFDGSEYSMLVMCDKPSENLSHE
jgi:hypothetical protein